jgi:hypothetical protein
MYLKHKPNKFRLATFAAAISIAVAALAATSASASVSGQIGYFQVPDPTVYCSTVAYGSGVTDSLTVNAPTVFAMSGYSRQQVGWGIRAYRVLSDGTRQQVGQVYGNGGYVAWATPTTAASLGQIQLAGGILFGGGNILIALDIYWFDAGGHLLGSYSGFYGNYFENINGFWLHRPYCQL